MAISTVRILLLSETCFCALLLSYYYHSQAQWKHSLETMNILTTCVVKDMRMHKCMGNGDGHEKMSISESQSEIYEMFEAHSV